MSRRWPRYLLAIILTLDLALLVGLATAPTLEHWEVKLPGVPGYLGIAHDHCQRLAQPGEGYGLLLCYNAAGELEGSYPIWRYLSARRVG